LIAVGVLLGVAVWLGLGLGVGVAVAVVFQSRSVSELELASNTRADIDHYLSIELNPIADPNTRG
jgi:hypothetical protein